MAALENEALRLVVAGLGPIVDGLRSTRSRNQGSMKREHSWAIGSPSGGQAPAAAVDEGRERGMR